MLPVPSFFLGFSPHKKVLCRFLIFLILLIGDDRIEKRYNGIDRST
jgi:hypothetical protein